MWEMLSSLSFGKAPPPTPTNFAQLVLLWRRTILERITFEIPRQFAMANVCRAHVVKQPPLAPL